MFYSIWNSRGIPPRPQPVLPFATAWYRLLCIGVLCMAVVGCMPEDGFRHYAGAVGPDLYSKQTIANTSLLNAYTGSICTQAGLVSGGQCVIRTPADWKSFVDMGLYDIDQRCDTFLDGLYYKAKTGDSILSQISDTGTFTAAVLDAASSSEPSIKIVAAAFDLAENSFRNTNNTLLQALDATTVKSLVFRRQQDIKEQIYSTTIWNKPQALHALRTYLRVCMPFAIEMEANAVLTTAQRTDGDIGDSPIVFAQQQNAPLAGNRTVIVKPNRPTGDTAPGWEAANASGSPITLQRAISIQKALCFEADAVPGMPKADGAYGDQTKAALRLFIAAQKNGFDAANWRNNDPKITRVYLGQLTASSEAACGDSKNYLEKVLFKDKTFVVDLKVALKDSLKDKFVSKNSSGAELSDIESVRINLGTYRVDKKFDNGPNGMFAKQVTPEVVSDLQLVGEQ